MNGAGTEDGKNIQQLKCKPEISLIKKLWKQHSEETTQRDTQKLKQHHDAGCVNIKKNPCLLQLWQTVDRQMI